MISHEVASKQQNVTFDCAAKAALTVSTPVPRLSPEAGQIRRLAAPLLKMEIIIPATADGSVTASSALAHTESLLMSLVSAVAPTWVCVVEAVTAALTLRMWKPDMVVFPATASVLLSEAAPV